jgi:periplasmic protein TonB
MKHLILLTCAFITLGASAQTLEYYNRTGEVTDNPRKAFYLLEQKKISDTCWEKNYYRVGKPRMRSVQFKDRAGKTMHGNYFIYKPDGVTDTFGFYSNGKKTGDWYVLASNNRTLKQLHFENDVLVYEKDSMQLNEQYKKYSDSLKAAAPPGTKDIESEFAGGTRGWQQYLNKNLRYPQDAIDHEYQGATVIQFEVDETGKINGPAVFKSVEYSIDKEAMRMILQSPNWTPAVLHGRNVKSYKRQPVIFRLERG